MDDSTLLKRYWVLRAITKAIFALFIFRGYTCISETVLREAMYSAKMHTSTVIIKYIVYRQCFPHEHGYGTAPSVSDLDLQS